PKPRALGAFFLLPMRAWELLAGAAAALWLLQSGASRSKLFKNAASALGLGMIAFSMVAYDQTTPFPGIYALLPVGGTVLLILFAVRGTLVHRLLSTKVLVGIGLISYGAYLWHQPVFAFARHASSGEPSHVVMALLSIASLALAFASWKWVETPFRNKHAFARPRILRVSGYGLACLFVGGLALQANNGMAHRYSDDDRALLAFQDYQFQSLYRERTCFLHPLQRPEEFADECIAQNQPVLWGDSHAAALSFGLRETRSITQLATANCPPLANWEHPFAQRSSPNCSAANALALDVIEAQQPSHVVLLALWSYFGEQDLRYGLRETFAAIRMRSPHTEILVLGGTPHFLPDGPTAMFRAGLDLGDAAIDAPLRIEVSQTRVRKADRWVKATVDAFADDRVRFASQLERLCHGDRCIAALADPLAPDVIEPFAWDMAHLTKASSRFVGAMVHDLMRRGEHLPAGAPTVPAGTLGLDNRPVAATD
ncbi:MAG: acyltransferase family protein, partial [Pseudomonadota bacterium]